MVRDIQYSWPNDAWSVDSCPVQEYMFHQTFLQNSRTQKLHTLVYHYHIFPQFTPTHIMTWIDAIHYIKR